MKVLYGYRAYENPKVGVFRISTDEYRSPDGWVTREDEIKIIGETDDSYVSELKPTGHGEWVGDKVIQHKYILPLGVHKSRLVAWTTGQLTLAL